MQTKSDNPVNHLAGMRTPPLIQAYFEFNQLKQLYRQGWLRRGVPPEKCESVAEHTFSMAVLAMSIADAHFPELDQLKVLRMVLLHDFGEIYAGDITPADGVSAEDKHAREEASVEKVFNKLPIGKPFLNLWQEYEAGETAEARYVRQIDRLDMAMQAAVYHRQGQLDGHEFLNSARQAISDPELLTVVSKLSSLFS
ncbi:MAG TPA: HD domain-containing protein [Anaerolineae bacterium]